MVESFKELNRKNKSLSAKGRRKNKREEKDRRKKGLGPLEHSLKADIEGTGPVRSPLTPKYADIEGMNIPKKKKRQTQPDPLDKSRKTTPDAKKTVPPKKKYSVSAGGKDKGLMAASVKVGKDDTLSQIAKDNGTTVAALKAANNIKDVNKIRVGQTIKIPQTGVSTNPYEYMSKSEMAKMAKSKKKKKKNIAKAKAPSVDAFDNRKFKDKWEPSERRGEASGGMIGQSDMSAKKQKAPKKKKIPQYYKGGGKVKKNYTYGGRVAKYKE